MYPYSFGTMDWWMLVWAAFLVMGVVAFMVLLAVTPAAPRSFDRRDPRADTRAR